MEKNVLKMNGKLYHLPEGYYRVDGRFGWEIFDDRGAQVTHLLMTDHNQGGHNSDDPIIMSTHGVLRLKEVGSADE